MAIITDAELEKYQKKEQELAALQLMHQADAQLHTEDLAAARQKTKKFKTATIVCALLGVLGIGATYYYLNDQVGKQAAVLADYETRITDYESHSGLLAMEDGSSLEDQEVYAVQIGAFEERDLALYSENFVNFKEIKNDGFNKYALGNFESLEEAKAFRKELVALGMKDAFIGFYQNGERLHIEKVVD